MEKKKSELRISYTNDSDYSAFVDYFQRHKMSPRSVFLDAIRLLWEPYLISEDGGLSYEEVERLVDISLQRYLNHYQLMCVELGLKRPGFEGGFSRVSNKNTNGVAESLRSTGVGKCMDFNSRSVGDVSVPESYGDADVDGAGDGEGLTDSRSSVEDVLDDNLIEGGFDFG